MTNMNEQTKQTDHASHAHYVVFMDAPEKPYLKCFKKGFRHCAYIVKYQDQWLIFDPLSARTDLMVAADTDLLARFRAAGFTYVPVRTTYDSRPRFLCPELLTCVTQMKRMLGIHRVTIQTPYQLYKFLQKDKP